MDDWIKCTDKLPNEGEEVIVWVNNGITNGITIGCYYLSYPDDVPEWIFHIETWIGTNPIAWIPSPGPYKG